MSSQLRGDVETKMIEDFHYEVLTKSGEFSETGKVRRRSREAMSKLR